ncbi:general secretion pathway protein F, partial [Pseudomonas sp. M47T1]
MAHFKYRALDAEGVSQQGSVEATDQQAAVTTLQKRGL